MTLHEAFAQRRSCRNFETAPIERELLESVLGAVLAAPSAGNSWGLDLVVLDTPESVAAYWDTTLANESIRERFPWPGLLNAPVLIIPTVRIDAYVQRYSESDKAQAGLGDSAGAWTVPYWWVDSGAAIMAMLLAATDAGLGSLLFGVFDHSRAVAELLGIPSDRSIAGCIALGLPATKQRPSASAKRGRPALETFVHRGHW